MADALARYGVSAEKAKALGKYAAPKLLRTLQVREEQYTNCDAAVLVAEMKAHGVELVADATGHVLRAKDFAAERWRDEVLAVLRLRKAEIVAAWDVPPDEGVRHCGKCLAQVYGEYSGAGCPFILSCPFHSYRGEYPDADS